MVAVPTRPRGTSRRVPEPSGTPAPPTDSAAQACALPAAWRGKAAWRILDTAFGDGQAFADTWATWLADPQAPRHLHYVALSEGVPLLAPLLHRLGITTRMADQSAALRQQWLGFSTGSYRLSLHDGCLLLTLCIGPRLALLRDQRFVADAAYAPAHGWDAWSAKALVRLAHDGMPLALARDGAAPADQLLQAGFVLRGAGNAGFQSLRFEPRWAPGRSRDRWRTLHSAPTTCAVIGAGLAGAAVAAAMARRGWTVSVIDAQAGPGNGTSGLPVGLLVAQGALDNSARAQLSRAGVRLTLQTCRELLQAGLDWMPTGVLQLQAAPPVGGGPCVNQDDWSVPYAWPSKVPPWAAGAAQAGALWHAHSAWIKPERLVRALLARSGAAFIGNTRVQAITQAANGWNLLDAHGDRIGCAAHVVFANATDATRLLRETSARGMAGMVPLAHTQSVGGQLTWGLHAPSDADAFPPHPVNGAGSFVAGVPQEQGLAWYAGATYEAQDDGASGAAERLNLTRLAQLLPQASTRIAALAQQRPLQAWRGQRCVTRDRLPVCGALQAGAHPSLWISAAMGSRGLSYALLCAELIAAQANAEPLPVASRLARLVRPERV